MSALPLTGARQIPLDFTAPPASLDNFIAGRNGELIARLRQLDFPRVCYVWGEPGCGKTHLANALRNQHNVVVADDVGRLPADVHQALFDAFNEAVLGGPPLLVTGDRPPLQLDLREDLRSRLGAGLVFELKPLSDDEKRLAIAAAAQARGLPISDDFIAYLLAHFHRDMRSLMALIAALDRYSLAHQRPVTLPLLKTVLQEERLDPH